MKKRILSLLCVFVIVLLLLPTQAHATQSIGEIEDFEHLEGDNRFVKEEYRDNYFLDIEKTGLLDSGDKMINIIANILFSLIRILSHIVVSIFYFSMDFNIADLFAPQLDGIQAALKSNIFDTFFILAMCGVMWTLIKRMGKHDLRGIAVELGQVILVVLLSYAVASHSATVLSFTTSVTKEISVSAISGMNGQEGNSISSYAASSSGLIWRSLVHDPWLTIEFDRVTPAEEEVEAFLTTPPGSDDRAALVSKYMADHPGTNVFNKGNGGSQVGFLIVYLIPFLIKCAVFLFISMMQLAFQVLAVFYVILAPLILLLALFPSFGGIRMISNWLKKILESQVMVLIITFMLGMVLALDNLLYSLSSTFGWMVVIILEAVISLVLIVFHKSILKGLTKLNTTVQNPMRAQYQMAHSGNVFGALGEGSRNLNRYIAQHRHRQTPPDSGPYRPSGTSSGARAAPVYVQTSEQLEHRKRRETQEQEENNVSESQQNAPAPKTRSPRKERPVTVATPPDFTTTSYDPAPIVRTTRPTTTDRMNPDWLVSKVARGETYTPRPLPDNSPPRGLEPQQNVSRPQHLAPTASDTSAADTVQPIFGSGTKTPKAKLENNKPQSDAKKETPSGKTTKPAPNARPVNSAAPRIEPSQAAAAPPATSRPTTTDTKRREVPPPPVSPEIDPNEGRPFRRKQKQ